MRVAGAVALVLVTGVLGACGGSDGKAFGAAGNRLMSQQGVPAPDGFENEYSSAPSGFGPGAPSASARWSKPGNHRAQVDSWTEAAGFAPMQPISCSDATVAWDDNVDFACVPEDQLWITGSRRMNQLDQLGALAKLTAGRNQTTVIYYNKVGH